MRIIDADEIRKKAVPHTRGEFGYNANIRKWAVLVGDIDDAPTIDAVPVPKDNVDDMNLAVYGLGIFRLSFCLNVKETDNQNEPVFRCGECLFEDKGSRKCAVKMFLARNATKEVRQRFSPLV